MVILNDILITSLMSHLSFCPFYTLVSGSLCPPVLPPSVYPFISIAPPLLSSVYFRTLSAMNCSPTDSDLQIESCKLFLNAVRILGASLLLYILRPNLCNYLQLSPGFELYLHKISITLKVAYFHLLIVCSPRTSFRTFLPSDPASKVP